MSRFLALLAACAAIAITGAGTAPASGAGGRWTDVPTSHWARTAVDYVAREHDWMRDYGSTTFKPRAPVTRADVATAVVRAFAPTAVPNGSIAFADLAADEPAYRYAAVAVARGWMARTPTGFDPTRAVTTTGLHDVLVRALGLSASARAVDRLATLDGYVFAHPARFGALNLGMALGLRTNHRDDALDVGPQTRLPRAELAWSLYRAKTLSPGRLATARSYTGIRLPAVSPAARDVIDFGLRWVGQPYVWGGQTAYAPGAAPCCGSQPLPGFDCSGFVWWLFRTRAAGYDPTAYRPYAGWAVRGRTADQIARGGKPRLTWRRARPGDLLFYDANTDGTIDHVNVALGNGWALDASASRGGVTVISLADGWHRAHFAWALRIAR
jgi:cell wall-associated NlpC family hydrolase